MEYQNKVSLFGIEFDNLSMEESISKIDEMIIRNRNNSCSSYVVTPNVDHIVNTYKSKEFKNVYNKASLSLVDGAPIMFLSNLFKQPLKEKVSGSDLTPKLFELAQKRQYRVFIFGSMPGVADTAVSKLKERFGYTFPVETFSPPFHFEKNKEVLDDCIKRINNFNPDILLVSVGSPKGELFIYKHQNELNIPISLQIGASIDFIAGTVKRAPVWMQKSGLEWFYRFAKEPKRLFKRYFINDSYFFVIIMKEFMKKR